ncbi:SymE family type I addiction module toxin [Burkholderia pseudomultivorans]|nr:SymE family type I addiction module toxin [Burkholderia pseudomultivorans]
MFDRDDASLDIRRVNGATRRCTTTCGSLTTTNSTQEFVMADAHHNVPTLFPDRFVTIQESFRYRRHIPRVRFQDRKPPVKYPWMKLSGRWIEDAGFEPAQRVRIEVTIGRLVITPIDERDCDHFGRDGFPVVDAATGLTRRRRPATKAADRTRSC